jgi:hypothetical protein
MTLENLLQIGKLKPHEPTHEELARLLAAAGRNLKDAGHAGISPESRFDIAYKAVMQCALLAMLAQGFRPSTNEPGHHALVIQSLPKTLDIPVQDMLVLDKLRKKRNLSDYTGEGVSEAEAQACARSAGKLFDAVDAFLKARFPEV